MTALAIGQSRRFNECHALFRPVLMSLFERRYHPESLRHTAMRSTAQQNCDAALQ